MLGRSQTKLAEGKTKIIWGPPGPGSFEVLIESKDDITAGDGAKRDVLPGKGIYDTQTTCNCFELLQRRGIATHYLGRVDERTFRARFCLMIPVELAARRLAYGSYLKRHPNIESGTRFEEPLVEFFFKDDSRHDPLMVYNPATNAWELFEAKVPFPSSPIGSWPANGWLETSKGKVVVPVEVVGALRQITQEVFLILEEAWAVQKVTLVDLKIECGFDVKDGKLRVGDVIENGSWRIWPEGDPKAMLDKQVYRDGSDSLEAILERYRLVAEATGKFLEI